MQTIQKVTPFIFPAAAVQILGAEIIKLRVSLIDLLLGYPQKQVLTRVGVWCTARHVSLLLADDWARHFATRNGPLCKARRWIQNGSHRLHVFCLGAFDLFRNSDWLDLLIVLAYLTTCGFEHFEPRFRRLLSIWVQNTPLLGLYFFFKLFSHQLLLPDEPFLASLLIHATLL